jgi:hypothetical protein
MPGDVTSAEETSDRYDDDAMNIQSGLDHKESVVDDASINESV